MKNYCVYILTNKANQVLYIGVTNNLNRRLCEHRNGLVEGFTKKYNVAKLVYFEQFTNISDALANEKKLKGWLRQKKIDLINSNNPNWEDLSLRDPSFHSG